MKTTLDIPEALFREAKLAAAREGTTLRAVVTRALQAELARTGAAPSWRLVFGGLKHLHQEREAVDRAALSREHHLPVVSRDPHFDAVPGLRRVEW